MLSGGHLDLYFVARPVVGSLEGDLLAFLGRFRHRRIDHTQIESSLLFNSIRFDISREANTRVLVVLCQDSLSQISKAKRLGHLRFEISALHDVLHFSSGKDREKGCIVISLVTCSILVSVGWKIHHVP